MSVADSLKQFFQDIWGDEPSKIFLATKPTPDSFQVSQGVAVPENLDAVVTFVMKQAVNQDTYFTPGLFGMDATAKEKAQGKRAKVFWVDIDGYHDGQGSVEAALTALGELGLPEPSYRIQSSQPGAEHWYWLLQEYVPAKIVNMINQRLAYYLKGDKACWDISHVLRPPFTHNFKEDYDKPQVKIIHANRERLDAKIFKKVPKVKEMLDDFITRPEKLLTRDEFDRMYPYTAEACRLADLEKKDFKDFGGRGSRGSAMVKLGYEWAEVGASDEVLFSVLYYVDDKWEKFKHRPDRDRYIKDIVYRVRMKYPAMTFAVDPDTEDRILEPHDSIQTIYGFKDFLESEFEYSWLIENLVPDNSINFIASRPGVGKSRFTLQMACNLGMGTNFLGHAVVGGPKKVVYFSLEMGPPVLKYFVEGVADSMKDELDLDHLNEHVKLLPMGNPLDLEREEGQRFFQRVMELEKPDVVFIDALSSLTSEDLNEKASKTVANMLKKWLVEYNCTFYLVHHNRKENQASPNKPPTLSDFYGNTFASTDAASILGLWKSPADEEDDVQMHVLKGRTTKGEEKRAWVLDGSKMTFTKKREITSDDIPGSKNIKAFAAFNPHSPNGNAGFGVLGDDSF